MGRLPYAFSIEALAQAPDRQELLLTAEPHAVRTARSWLTQTAAARIAGLRRSDLELVVSEIVTNAVCHGRAGGHVLLAATPKPEFLCVQVTDDGPGLVPRPGAMASDEYGGFGLFLVERLTRRCVFVCKVIFDTIVAVRPLQRLSV